MRTETCSLVRSYSRRDSIPDHHKWLAGEPVHFHVIWKKAGMLLVIHKTKNFDLHLKIWTVYLDSVKAHALMKTNFFIPLIQRLETIYQCDGAFLWHVENISLKKQTQFWQSLNIFFVHKSFFLLTLNWMRINVIKVLILGTLTLRTNAYAIAFPY